MRSLSILVLLALPIAAFASDPGYGTAVDRLLAASPATVAVRRVDARRPVEVVLGLPWRDERELASLVRDLADPQSPRFGRYLSAQEFDRRFAPLPEGIDALVSFLQRSGLEVTDVSASGRFITAGGDSARVESALAAKLLSVTGKAGEHLVLQPDGSLGSLASATVVSVTAPGAADELQPPGGDPNLPPQEGSPFRPADIARFYHFDDLYDAGYRGSGDRASTVAIATAYGFDRADLQRFWDDFDISRSPDSVELIAATGPITSTHTETDLDVQWTSAMAPGSRVLVYAGDKASSSTFLKVYDRIISDDRAALVTTSWGGCEPDLPSSFLDQAHALFERAAAQGMTVLAASGDSGAYQCGDNTPSVGFPASDPYVLAVGGTTLHDTADGVTETAWRGSGGGVSQKWPAPPWQMRPESMRVMADVALNADPATGYMMAHDGIWWSSGGTSVAAPIWAALLALVNQYRSALGRPALGLAAPALCEVANARDLPMTPLRDITAGDNQVYAAERGWDFPTGWGTPNAFELARSLAEWSAPAEPAGGRSSAVMLAPSMPGIGGAVRLKFSYRCLTTAVSLYARYAPPGAYTLDFDGEPVASFQIDPKGRAILEIPNLDARGHAVTVTAVGGPVVFAGSLSDEPRRSRRLRADMYNTGAASAAHGRLLYRYLAGREQLVVHVDNLPSGEYSVHLGDRAIGSLSVHSEGNDAIARFDTNGTAGALLRSSPLCEPIKVIRSGTAFLRSTSTALSFGECSP